MKVRSIIALVFMAMLLAACGAGSGSPSSTASPTAEAPAATATVTAPRAITGLFTEPRPSPGYEPRRLGPEPEVFPVWNGVSTMIYDVQTSQAIDLGPGSLGRFSPDSTRMVWIAGPAGGLGDGEAWMIDLRTMERRDLGPGRLAGFVDDSHAGVTRPASNTTDVIDLATDARTTVDGIPFFPDLLIQTTSDGYVLRRSGFAPDQENSFSLSDPRTGAVLLQFTASAASSAGHGAIVVASLSVPTGPRMGGYRATNIFLVDIASGEATFVATAGAYVQFPLVADDGYVAWTENYCDGGNTRIYDRDTKKISEVDASLWPVAMANGLILEGPFGGRALIDPATLQYRAALPPGVGDTSWSPDHRYTSLGQYGGHGGPCM